MSLCKKSLYIIMKPAVFTPYYLRRENGEIYRTSFTRDSTSYTVRPEWVTQRLAATSATPAAPHLADWSTQPMGVGDDQGVRKAHAQICGKADAKYKRAYDALIMQLAYRYPNPGSPRHREGSSGSSWRHVNHILSHNGSRVIYIDGRTSLYDDDNFTQELQGQLKYRPHLQALYTSSHHTGTAPTHPVLSATMVLAEDTKPPVPSSSILRYPDMLRKLELQKEFQTNRRGFYRFK